MWMRRTALLAQLRHKTATDEAMLFDFCRRRAHEKEFFIRKAIGWALREYARVNPGAVRSFLSENEAYLSGLSRREAARHL
jgi:3-methyladenine DNA glycosylase AlkD